MAIIERFEAELFGPGNLTSARFTYFYNDVSLKLTGFRCHNTSADPVTASVTSTSTRDSYQHTFGAGTDITLPLSVPQQNRFGVTVLPNGKVDGVDFSCWW